MSEETYEGWTNKETWAVKLHWDNNQADYSFFTQQAKEFKEEGKSVIDFSDFLKEQLEEIQETVFNGEGTEEARNLLRDVGSIWRVNYDEIAKAYYEEVNN